jgi:hypothetical protein
MAPSLDSAYAKLERAREHLERVKERIEALRQPHVDSVPVRRDPSDPKVIAGWTMPNPIDHRMSPMIGDVVQNLRAALDHLVHAIAWVDSGQPQKHTQFPVDDAPQKFSGHSATFLKGVSVSHVARLEQLQPYNGCKWTELIRDLSNTDKHRELIVISSSGRGTFSFGLILKRDAETGRFVPASDTLQMQSSFTQQITLRDGTPIVDALHAALSQAAHLLDEFKTTFV